MNNNLSFNPSDAERLIACPSSAWLEAESMAGGRFSEEGIEAHRLLEHVLTCDKTGAPDPRPQLSHYSDEMEKAVQFAAAFINGLYESYVEIGDSPVMMVEQWVDLSQYAPGAKGQVDCIIMADGEMIVIDYKYGAGIPVDPKENKQLLSYALGALESLTYPPFLADPQKIHLLILQPRVTKEVNWWTVNADYIRNWGEKELKPSAFMCACGIAQPNNGEWCRTCPNAGVCRVRAEVLENVTPDATHDYAPPLLTNDEICSLLRSYDQIMDFLDSFMNSAIQKAIEGEEFPGFRLVKKYGRSTFDRNHKDEVAKILQENGVYPFEKNRVISVASASRKLGKDLLYALLGRFIQPAPDRYHLEKIDESEVDEEL